MTATQTALAALLTGAGIDAELVNDSPDGDTVVVDLGEGERAIVVGFDDAMTQTWIDYTVYDAEQTIERTDGAEPHRAAGDVAKLVEQTPREVTTSAWNAATSTWEVIARESSTGVDLDAVELSAQDLGGEVGTVYRVALISANDRELRAVDIVAR